MTNDFHWQAEFVAQSAWRLLSLQDANTLSPTYGCFHYAYWRDKTSEFADARFQEAGATLGLLSLPAFDGIRAQSSERLYEAFSAALTNWSRQQYPEGAFDEWYKGERGFAAAEFPMIAYGLAARFLGDSLKPDDRQILTQTLNRAAAWLSIRHDLVKTNHEAAAAAALALAWDATGDQRWRSAARAAIDNVLSRQTPEGWFPEVGGMDLGYCSVLLDYVMLYTLVTGDACAIPAMRRLFAFMLPHIHPDGTISPEAGLCLNPYVSRVGLGLLSAHDPSAAALVRRLVVASPGTEALIPYLADDLRLCRWSHLPLAAWLLFPGFNADPSASDLYPSGWTWRKQAAVAAYHGPDWHVYFSPAGGGAVRVFHQDWKVCEDLGLSVDYNGPWHNGQRGSAGYDPDRDVTAVEDGFRMDSQLGPASFFFPGFIFRLILRLGCVTPLSSKWLRAAIDFYRLKMRTAVNQSAAPMAKGAGDYAFSRTVTVTADGVRIEDVLTSAKEALPAGAVKLAFDPRRAIPVIGGGKSLRISKFITADQAVTIQWEAN